MDKKSLESNSQSLHTCTLLSDIWAHSFEVAKCPLVSPAFTQCHNRGSASSPIMGRHKDRTGTFTEMSLVTTDLPSDLSEQRAAHKTYSTEFLSFSP